MNGPAEVSDRDAPHARHERRDFASARRLPMLAALAAVIGAASTAAAWALLGPRFVGMLDRALLVQALRSPGEGRVADLIGAVVPPVALANDNCRETATRLAAQGLERLPVVADLQSLRLLGIVSRSDLIKPSLEIDVQEQRRERFFGLPRAATGTPRRGRASGEER